MAGVGVKDKVSEVAGVKLVGASRWTTGRTRGHPGRTEPVRLSFGMGYPVVEFVEQVVDLEQEMTSK